MTAMVGSAALVPVAMDVDAPQALDFATVEGVSNAVLDDVQHVETAIAHTKEERRQLVTKKYRLGLKMKAALEASDTLLVNQLNVQIMDVEDKMLEHGCGAAQMRRVQGGVDEIINDARTTRTEMYRRFDSLQTHIDTKFDQQAQRFIALATGAFDIPGGSCKDQIRLNMSATRLLQNRTAKLRESDKATSAAIMISSSSSSSSSSRSSSSSSSSSI